MIQTKVIALNNGVRAKLGISYFQYLLPSKIADIKWNIDILEEGIQILRKTIPVLSFSTKAQGKFKLYLHKHCIHKIQAMFNLWIELYKPSNRTIVYSAQNNEWGLFARKNFHPGEFIGLITGSIRSNSNILVKSQFLDFKENKLELRTDTRIIRKRNIYLYKQLIEENLRLNTAYKKEFDVLVYEVKKRGYSYPESRDEMNKTLHVMALGDRLHENAKEIDDFHLNICQKDSKFCWAYDSQNELKGFQIREGTTIVESTPEVFINCQSQMNTDKTNAVFINTGALFSNSYGEDCGLTLVFAKQMISKAEQITVSNSYSE